MKYCKKCGMLLEDNMDICIGCGSDVTSKGSYSKYPEQMQAKIDSEKKEQGTKNLAVVAIVLIFVVIVLLVGIFISQSYVQSMSENGKIGKGLFAPKNDASDKKDDKPAKKRDVKDDTGTYYKYTTVKDDAGNELFYAVYPEDLSDVEHTIDKERESQLFPSVFSFVATNEDNTTQLTYTSPQHYQYIVGDNLSQVDIQERLNGKISFYNFTSVENYLKEIVGQAYPTAKKIETLADEEASKEASDKLDEVVSIYEKDAEKHLAKLFGLSDQTTFSLTDTYKSAKIFNYRILTSEDHAVSCKFYVPVFCEYYDYEDPEEEISGQLLDCYIMAVVSFEAGSDELYDWYEDAFDMFVNNTKLYDGFFKAENLPGEGDPAGGICSFLNTPPTSVKSFKADKYTVNSGAQIEQIYLDPDRELIYATRDKEEYPGDTFTELTAGSDNEGN